MYLDEYQKMTIENFMGLWDRGSLDDIPPDHAADILNVSFARKRECQTRIGADPSTNLSHNVVRMFLATFNNSSLILLTCDGAGNIYREDTGAVLLNVPNMIDFSALNMYNKCFIAPLLSSYSSTNYIQVWGGPGTTIHPIGGQPPSASFTAVETGTGNVVAGQHEYAVSYITDTGYVTPPGPVISGTFTPVILTSSGGMQVQLNGLPIGPAGTVGRQIYATKSGLTEFFYLATINDNTATTILLNYFDTDLVLSADSLFDLNPSPISGVGFSGCALIKYHERMLIIGPLADKVQVSGAGNPESFNNVTGFINIPSEHDGNTVGTGFDLFSVLYLCKGVGTFSAQDNGSEPNDPNTPWVVNSIDGVVGAYHHTIGTVTGSQASLTFNSVALMANYSGLFLFNGNVQRPELSWKIRGVWERLTFGYAQYMRIAVDAFHDVFYLLMPLDGATSPNTLLLGDFSLGLSSEQIRWSVYTFPWTINEIMMANYVDGVGDYGYYLRLGTPSGIYKLSGKTAADNGTAINSYYETPAMTPSMGSYNVFRFIRYRCQGSGSLLTSLRDEGGVNPVTVPNLPLQPGPGNSKDLGIQINYMNEKILVKFGTNAVSDNFKMARFDLFGKMRFPTRPNG